MVLRETDDQQRAEKPLRHRTERVDPVPLCGKNDIFSLAEFTDPAHLSILHDVDLFFW